MTNFEAFRISDTKLQKRYIITICSGAGCAIVKEDCSKYNDCRGCPYDVMNHPAKWLDEEYDPKLDVFKIIKGV